MDTLAHLSLLQGVIAGVGLLLVVLSLRAMTRPFTGYWRRRKAKFARQVPLSAAEIDTLFAVTRDPAFRLLSLISQLALLLVGFGLAGWIFEAPDLVRVPLARLGLVALPCLLISLGLMFVTRTEIYFRIGRLSFPVLFHPDAKPVSWVAKRYASYDAFKPGWWKARGWGIIIVGLLIAWRVATLFMA